MTSGSTGVLIHLVSGESILIIQLYVYASSHSQAWCQKLFPTNFVFG